MITLKEKLTELNLIPTQEENEEEKNSERNEISTTTAFLIGVKDKTLSERTDLFDKKILQKLRDEKDARIIRNLCMLRTAMFQYNTRIYRAMKYEAKSLYTIEEVPYECLTGLEKDGIHVVKNKKYSKNEYTADINRLIQDRIWNCRKYYPEWVPWNYIKDMFVIPDGANQGRIKASSDFFMENMKSYPYMCYINAPVEGGNILVSDKTFCRALYGWNGAEFEDSRVTDITEATKENIKKFFSGAIRMDIVIDCENSNPYRVCSALPLINEEARGRVNRIILINDPHTSSAWSIIGEYTDIPVKEILIERLVEHKSLADVKLTAAVCEEYYQEHVDSFCLLSSDSDFWGLISSLPKADFLVMVEEEKCGRALQDKLLEEKIYYCYLNDFYSGNQWEVMRHAVTKNFLHAINRGRLGADLEEVYQESVTAARAEMDDAEKEKLFKKLVNRLMVNIVDGKLMIGLR